ncbi:Carbohydrate esterase family 9 protein [Colletotrichum higginsianum IMI 349063]|uniref:Carbohydrate esterase family 9 protein n=2 Tax=Colletotrichum higginsianum TaxID=80884 RepID=A0A1B7YQF0_COLHI|nr:Carbohydrate esterase family 9 protein [Colletotrichum higginsianum IMI 349063]OBR14270.1 Carbohydrate esterase family 9 protein [Colletotrichum higginsianum IMI 349063]
MMALPQATLPSKEAGFHDDNDSSFPVPPPYEAAAYPRVRPRRAIARSLVSPRVLVCVFFAALLAWPALLLVREATLRDVARHASSSAHLARFRDSVKHCAALRTLPENPEPGSRKSNPRWNPARGQARPVVLRNMTFFDGESVAPEPMDIRFDRGLITELATTASRSIQSRGGAAEDEHDLHGRFVTPGLVDMHSHHSTGLWPALPVTSDENEMSKAYGPLTPFMRILDSMKAYDDATRIIMSGGITTSLILPGSANVMGGEGTVIKNVLKSGELGEYVVEELLLEHNIPPEARHRYMKLACGENPKRVYGHTRMANAYILREQFAKAKEHLQKQDEYCEAVASVSPGSDDDDDLKLRFVRDHGDFPSDLKLESTVGMLRGRVAMQNHCYLPEDFETMLRVTKEYGVRVRAFHHALEAWQVPEMLKAYGENVTVATFAEFSLYKFEAYAPSLSSGRILNEHGIPVAYKSDHGPASETNAKYIMFQAGVGHAFHLPEDKALQSVTSIPANAIDLGYRVGYARPGYDADLVVWDAHPLSIGATPLQVYVDGNPQLEHHIVRESMGTTFNEASAEGALPASPKMRTEPAPEKRAAFCGKAKKARAGFVINGITNTFLESHPQVPTVFRDVAGGNLTLVISNGAVACLGTPENCSSAAARVSAEPDVTTLDLSNGHVLPGLTALTASLGMVEIATEDSTGDGFADPKKDGGNPENLDFAKYGVQLEGKAFSRARLGGITRAVTPPLSEEGGFVNGVSVGILTRTDRTLLDGGVFRPEVALHVTIDDKAKAGVGSISTAVKKLRKILADGKGKHNETTFGEVASGKLPLVVNANNHWDIQQIINIKKDFPDVNIVIQGGAEAPLVALELAESQIPVILTETRPAPYSFRHRDAVVGPPLTPSVARILSEAGVYFAVAIVADIMPADYRIHDLALEAAWAAKYANLGDKEAVRLVSSNVEDILGLPKSNDIVVWEDSPLEFGGTVALSFETSKDGELEVAACWPQEHDK